MILCINNLRGVRVVASSHIGLYTMLIIDRVEGSQAQAFGTNPNPHPYTLISMLPPCTLIPAPLESPTPPALRGLPLKGMSMGLAGFCHLQFLRQASGLYVLSSYNVDWSLKT